MHFDRDGNTGIRVCTQVENGKARVEVTVCLQWDEEENSELIHDKQYGVEVEIQENGNAAAGNCGAGDCTGGGNIVAQMHKRFSGAGLAEAAKDYATEVVLETLFIHPHLWQGTERPYLYSVKAYLLRGETVEDKAETVCGIYTLSFTEEKGFRLNGKSLPLQAVKYQPPIRISGQENWENRLEQDCKNLLELGANAVFLEEKDKNPILLRKLKEAGLILCRQDSDYFPPYCDTTKESLMAPDRQRKLEGYYKYRARYSKEPFVYLCRVEAPEVKNALLTVKAYSNQKKMALYVDGILFEFQESAPEFLFQDVPVNKLTAVLTVQAGECCFSRTLYKRS